MLWPDGLAFGRRSIPVAYNITQRSQAVDADFHGVARLEEVAVGRGDTFGRARRDDVAGLQRDAQRAGLDEFRHGEDELRGELRLDLFAIQVRREVELVEVESGRWGQAVPLGRSGL